MKTRILATRAAFLPLLLCFPPQRAARTKKTSLADLLPGNTIFYLSIPSLGTLQGKCRKSPLAPLLARKEVPLLLDFLFFGKPPKGRPAFSDLAARFLATFGGEVSFARLSSPGGKRLVLRAADPRRSGGARAFLEKGILPYLKSKGLTIEEKKSPWGAPLYEARSPMDLIRLFVRDGAFYLVRGEGAMEALHWKKAPARPPLSQTPGFEKARARMLKGSRPALFQFFRLREVMERRFRKIRILEGEKALSPWRAAGIPSIRFVANTVSFGKEGITDRFWVETSLPARKPPSLHPRPADWNPAAWAPGDTTIFLEFQAEPIPFLALLQAWISETATTGAFDPLPERLIWSPRAVKGLAEGLGPNWAVFAKTKGLSLFSPFLVLVVQVKDPGKVQAALEKGFRVPGEVSIRHTVYRGKAIHYCRGKEISMLNPCWCLFRRRLYLALAPLALKWALRNAEGRTPALAEQPEFKSFRIPNLPAWRARFYLDPMAFLPWVYVLEPESILPLDSPEFFLAYYAVLQSAEMEAFAAPIAGFARKEPDGWSAEVHTRGGLSLGLTMAALAFSDCFRTD